MKTSIESINGKEYTVVWHKPEYSDKILCALDIPIMFGYELTIGIDHIATALPALPKYPEPEHDLLWGKKIDPKRIKPPALTGGLMESGKPTLLIVSKDQYIGLSLFCQ